MRYLKAAVITMLFVCLGVFSAAYAQQAGSAACGSRLKKFTQARQEARAQKKDQLYEKLKLTQEQKDKLEANKEQHRAKVKASFEQMRTLYQELNQELAKPSLDMKKINVIQEKLKKLQSEMSDARLESMLQIRKILTAEQFGEFSSYVSRGKRSHFMKGRSMQEKAGPDPEACGGGDSR